MNWSKAKTILIVVFLLLNLFLLTTYRSILKSGSDTDAGQLNQILQKNNITLKQNVFKSMPRRLKSVELRNLAGDKEACAEKFLKDGYMTIGDGEYQKGTQKLTIRQSTLEYSDSRPSDTTYQNMTQEKMADKLSDTLAQLGVAKAALRQTEAYQNDAGEWVFVYQLQYQEFPIFNSELQVTVSRQGITGIKGALLMVSEENAMNIAYDILSLQNILLELLSNPELSSRTPQEVHEVTLGYYIPKNDVVISTEAIPAYLIRMGNGKLYYYDARTGVPNAVRLLAVENRKGIQ